MLFSIVPTSNRLSAIAGRIVVGGVLIALGYVAALVTSQGSEVTFGIGRVGATRHAALDAGHPGEAPSPADTTPAHDFDYFPDHYNNQAREVAEQPPTF
jgi:hypothetical protein